MQRQRAGLFVALLALAVAGCGDSGRSSALGLAGLRVVTFNTGTTDGLPIDPSTNAGYGPEQAALADQWYGNGLAWNAAVEDSRRFFSTLRADIVGFQEIFHPDDCAEIPAAARLGFVCESWQPGDPTVVQRVVGADYQVACHLGKSDKCIAVRRSLGTIRGCDSALCLDGLLGADIAGCGRGSRVGRALVDLHDGTTLTVAHVHGTSGFSASDRQCRVAQFRQLFEDLGDGSGLAASAGERSIVLGDFNTDPGRSARLDPSAQILAAAGEPPSPFRFLTEIGPQALPTYLGAVNIDHVLARGFTGSCWAAGIRPDRPPVTTMTYFDHTAIVCDLEAAAD